MFARTVRLTLGFLHVLAQHKLATQQLHRAQGSRHYGLGAQFAHQAWFTLGISFGARQKVFTHGDGGAGQACQHLVATTVKVGPPQLVGGKCDGGFGIRHAQQRFSQAHQGQAFCAGNGVLLQQAFHGPKRRWVVAHGLHPRCRRACRICPIQRLAHGLQMAGDHLSFRAVRERKALRDGHRGLQVYFLQDGLSEQPKSADVAIFAEYNQIFSLKFICSTD